MKLTILLTAVLLITACSKSGGSDNSSTSAQSVSGTYKMTGARANGDVVVLFATFSDGQYIAETYKFPGGNMFRASYIKYVYSDIVSGTTHSTTQTYATCQTLNGITIPTTESFPVTPIGNNQIIVHSNGANADIVFAASSGINQELSAMGMTIANEVTDCTATF